MSAISGAINTEAKIISFLDKINDIVIKGGSYLKWIVLILVIVILVGAIGTFKKNEIQ